MTSEKTTNFRFLQYINIKQFENKQSVKVNLFMFKVCLQKYVTVVQKTTLDSRPGKKEKFMSQNQPKRRNK